MWDSSYITELNTRRNKSILGGGEERINKQHHAGKLSARERIDILLDDNSFVEINDFVIPDKSSGQGKQNNILGDGVVTGFGEINGRKVFISSQDFTAFGGTLGVYHSQKICHIMDLAINNFCPYICINDSGGARIEEGISSLDGYSSIFYRNTKASGVIPQISVILGPCAGGACYSPAITDFIFMTKKTSKMFITGPGVVKSIIGEKVSVDQLGGSQIHAELSGVSHFVYDDEVACLNGVKKLLDYLPNNNHDSVKVHEGFKYSDSFSFQKIVSDNPKKVYDIKDVICNLFDDDSFLEIQKDFAKNIVIGFARVKGETIGVVANQPMFLVGCLDINASDKAARFIRLCDCFNIPIVSLVDVPGFLPGKAQEHNGIIRHGAKMLYAYSEATVPKISFILRKAFGGAYIAMNSKHTGADMVFAWPIAQLAVMGAEGAVDIIYKNEIKNSKNPEAKRKELINEYNLKYMNPYTAAEKGFIDKVILPEETRDYLEKSLCLLKSKNIVCSVKKKHGNIPL